MLKRIFKFDNVLNSVIDLIVLLSIALWGGIVLGGAFYVLVRLFDSHLGSYACAFTAGTIVLIGLISWRTKTPVYRDIPSVEITEPNFADGVFGFASYLSAYDGVGSFGKSVECATLAELCEKYLKSQGVDQAPRYL